MSRLAPVLQGFFTDKLLTQKHASPHTVAAYRDTWRLLLAFAQQATGTPPWKMNLSQLDHDLVTGFLRYLETERNNSLRTRNARLAAIHSMFRYAALRAPEDAAEIQRVLAIDGSQANRTDISWLTDAEAGALLAACDRATWIGRRDHAMILTALRTGLRVSELTHLTCDDVRLGTGAHVHCLGKGRKERSTPLDKPTAAGGEQRVAAQTCPTLASKKLAPHVLRHSTAMSLRRSGVDTSVIALWLGHEDTRSTQVYIHADLEMKERALARTTPPDVQPGRYKAPDPLLAYLESL